MLKLLSIFRRRDDLLSSKLFNEKSFHAFFCRDLSKAKKSVVIESPYLTERRAAYYMPLFRKLIRRNINIRINTRHPKYHSAEMRLQANNAARVLLNAGVKIYTYNDLRHWKLAVIDKVILWEGSLNILSHSCSREIMRRTFSSYFCREMINFAKLYY